MNDHAFALGLTRDSGDSVDAAALGRLHDYMRRVNQCSETEELIARDAYLAGFRYGARWAIHSTSQLSSPVFRDAIQVLADVVRSDQQ